MAPNLVLTIRNNITLERIEEMKCSEAVIGRSETSTIRLADILVSREHAMLSITPNHCFIRDLGSRNGTFVDGHKVVGSTSLHDQAVVYIRPYSLTVFFCGGADNQEAVSLDESTRKEPVSAEHSGDDSHGLSRLTPAQHRVFECLLKGLSEKETAHHLQISINTVHDHAKAIYRKFSVSSRSELLATCSARLKNFRP